MKNYLYTFKNCQLNCQIKREFEINEFVYYEESAEFAIKEDCILHLFGLFSIIAKKYRELILKNIRQNPSIKKVIFIDILDAEEITVDLSSKFLKKNRKIDKLLINNIIESHNFEIIEKRNFILDSFSCLIFKAFNKVEEEKEERVSYKVAQDPKRGEILPREKLSLGMVDEMKLYELISVILGSGNKKEDVFNISKRIIKEYGSISLVEERDPKKIQETLKIGPTAALKLVAAFEIGRRFYDTRRANRVLIRGSNDVYQYAKSMENLLKENFRGLYLNSKHYLIKDEIISVGHLTASLVHPREVFRTAVEYSAAGIIVIHNHPSGDPEPSENDILTTQNLKKASEILQIPLLDHVIIGKGKYFSFSEEKKI